MEAILLWYVDLRLERKLFPCWKKKKKEDCKIPPSWKLCLVRHTKIKLQEPQRFMRRRSYRGGSDGRRERHRGLGFQFVLILLPQFVLFTPSAGRFWAPLAPDHPSDWWKCWSVLYPAVLDCVLLFSDSANLSCLYTFCFRPSSPWFATGAGHGWSALCLFSLVCHPGLWVHFPRCVMIYCCVELAPNQPERERDSRQLNSLKCVPHVCCNMEKISALSPPLTRTEPSLTLQQPECSDFTEQDPGCSAHTDSSTRTPTIDSNVKIRRSSDCTRDDLGINNILYHKCPCMCLFIEHGSGGEALILLTTRKSLRRRHDFISLY